jgi:hypothetical protein
MKKKITWVIGLVLVSLSALAAPPSSVAQLESALEDAAMPVQTAEYKAKLQDQRLQHADAGAYQQR